MKTEPQNVRLYMALNIKPSEAELLDRLADEEGLDRMSWARAILRRELRRHRHQQGAEHAA